ncbi:MAG: homoserine kinase, partial [Pseudomonadota bacterium]
MTPPTATAFAPASVGNVGVGFDILGHALIGPGDIVTARRIDAREVRVDAIRGTVTDLPRDVARNTGARAVDAMRRALDLSFGIALEIDKGIALGSGMGGSAASASAALVAANALLDAPLAIEALYPFALDGESAASGGRHGDNIGPQLLGGLVLSTADRLVKVPVPRRLWCALVHPHCVVETRRAREALRGAYAIGDFVPQSANLALVLAGCYRDDLDLIRAGLTAVLDDALRAPGVAGISAVARAGGAPGVRSAPIAAAWTRAAKSLTAAVGPGQWSRRRVRPSGG